MKSRFSEWGLVLEYENWLTSQVGTTYKNRNYILLLQKLHQIDFYHYVQFDENREGDGLALREEFVDLIFDEVYDRNRALDVLDNTCSMLEMMIGLSRRMEHVLYDISDSTISDCFWELADNAGYTEFDDYNYSNNNGSLEIDKLTGFILEREYDKYGMGGFFPLPQIHLEVEDQRKVELWYQMHTYIQQWEDLKR